MKFINYRVKTKRNPTRSALRRAFRNLWIVQGISIIFAFGALFVAIGSGLNGASQSVVLPVLRPIAMPTTALDPIPARQIIHLDLELPLTSQPKVNLPEKRSDHAQIANDLAWGKAAFASSYWQDGYPAAVTDGLADTWAWRSASSTNSWYFVDLEQSQRFTQIASTLFVDDHFTTAPHTYYIASNDLVNWQVIYDELNTDNKQGRGEIRLLRLAQPIEARYVGFYGVDWNGGWADLTTFAVIL